MSDDADGQTTDDGADVEADRHGPFQGEARRPPHMITAAPLNELDRDGVYGALQFCADRLVKIHGDRETDWHITFLRALAENELDPGIVTVHLPQSATFTGEFAMWVAEHFPDAVMANRGPDEMVIRPKEQQ